MNLNPDTDEELDLAMDLCHRVIRMAKPGSEQHAKASSALHKLRLEACRRTGGLGAQHTRARFPHY